MGPLLDRYGNLPVPEEKTRLTVVENPVDVAKAAFHLWRQVADAFPDCYGTGQVDRIYDEAVRCLSPHAETFKDVKAGELETIISETIPHKHSGLFLSALLNRTALRMLNGVFTSLNCFLGYKLAPGKILVAERGSKCFQLGYRAEGGVLANIGNAHNLALEASGGTQLNYGSAYDMADDVSGGCQINFSGVFNPNSPFDGRAPRHFARGASGGFQENYYGLMGFFASNATRGLHIAYGETGQMDWSVVKGDFLIVRERGNSPISSHGHDGQRIVSINRTDYHIWIKDRICKSTSKFPDIGWEKGKPYIIPDYSADNAVGLTLPLQLAVDELGEQLKVVKALGKGDSKSVTLAISGYDWNGFEEMVLNSSARISQLAKVSLK